MNTVYLLLGGNIGNTRDYLSLSINEIERKIGKITGRSQLYETAAWGYEGQPNFLNIAIKVETFLEPLLVLEKILDIEKQLGRERAGAQWKERTIDIDILLFNDSVIESSELKVPHPFLPERRFALAPLADIASDVLHPILKDSVLTLLNTCKDKLHIKALGFL